MHARVLHLRAWADGATDRLLRGVYLQRSTSLLVRARGVVRLPRLLGLIGR